MVLMVGIVLCLIKFRQSPSIRIKPRPVWSFKVCPLEVLEASLQSLSTSLINISRSSTTTVGIWERHSLYMSASTFALNGITSAKETVGQKVKQVTMEMVHSFLHRLDTEITRISTKIRWVLPKRLCPRVSFTTWFCFCPSSTKGFIRNDRTYTTLTTEICQSYSVFIRLSYRYRYTYTYSSCLLLTEYVELLSATVLTCNSFVVKTWNNIYLRADIETVSLRTACGT